MISPEQLAASGTEHGHQTALMCFCQQNLVKYPELRWLFAIPNGGARDKITAAKLKAEGVRAGVPDMFFPVSKANFHGMFIELKTAKGVVSSEQSEWIAYLIKAGYYAVVCRGWIEARDCIIWYLELKK